MPHRVSADASQFAPAHFVQIAIVPQFVRVERKVDGVFAGPRYTSIARILSSATWLMLNGCGMGVPSMNTCAPMQW